jgi:hypothetical protein
LRGNSRKTEGKNFENFDFVVTRFARIGAAARKRTYGAGGEEHADFEGISSGACAVSFRGAHGF